MKLKSEQLNQHLAAHFLPLYLVSGDEPLLIQEACDLIRHQARSQGYIERELFHGEKDDASRLLAAATNLSLFAERKLFEFRLVKSVSIDLQNHFLDWCDNPVPDQCLLISCPTLDKRAMQKSWYKKLVKLGAHITIWPVDSKHLPGWIQQRLQHKGLRLEQDALSVLAERVEGNLLAAQQEIERLSLLYADSTPITSKMMRETVGDNARFDSFELLEASFMGDAKKLTRLLTGLKLEGEAIARINGLLSFELRKLSKMAWDCKQGASPAQVLQKYYIWGNKKEGYGKALGRYPVSVWQRLLARCLELDKMIKGQGKGEPWMAMESLLLQISGNDLWKAQ